MPTIEIAVDGKTFQAPSGLTLVSEILNTSAVTGKVLFLSRDDDIDIPLLPEECLVLRGGEVFVTGASCIEDNPPVRNQLKPEFNGSHDLALPYAKITGHDLKSHDDKFPNGRLFVDIADSVDAEIPDEITIVVQDSDSFFVIPPASVVDDAIDVEECAHNDRKPPVAEKYRIRIDGEKHIVQESKVSGVAILALVGKSIDDWSLNQKLKGGRRLKIDDDIVDLSKPGIERFETVPKQAQQGDD